MSSSGHVQQWWENWRKRSSSWDHSRGSQSAKCSSASRHWWVKAPPLGQTRGGICALLAAGTDQPGRRSEERLCGLLFVFCFLELSGFFSSSSPLNYDCRWLSIYEGLCKQTSRDFCGLFAVRFVGMRHWWAWRGQDARQRRRLAETQRLHPGVHGRLPPGRLFLPVLRLHVSTKESRETGVLLHGSFSWAMHSDTCHPQLLNIK